MCIACLEYIKGTLKINEFKGALRETTRDSDEKHYQDIQKVISQNPDEEALKKKLQNLSK